MNYSSNILAMTIGCTCIGIFLFVANAGVWGEEARMREGNPTVIRMVTTYTPCYLSRDCNSNAAFGRFRLGEKIKRLPGKRFPVVDGGRQSFFVEYKMSDSEYRGFRNAKLFFDKGQERLYKIIAEQTFSHASSARDRMEIVKGIIDDCKLGYGLLLERNVLADNRMAYEGSDEIIVIVLEMHKENDGGRNLFLTITSKQMQNGEVKDGSADVDMQIDVDI